MRRAVAEDALAMAEVHVRTWQVAYRGLIPQEFLDGLRARDRARAYIFDRTRGAFNLVAEDAGVVCGLVIAGPARAADTPDVGEIYAIYVHPQRWGTGVGRVLMTAAREQLGRDGFGEVTLWVLTGNARARHFYELDGWEDDGGRRTDTFGGTAVEEVRYRRALG